MTFTRSELEMIYQYAATDRAATVAGLAEIVPVLKDPLTKAIVKNTIDKLEKIPEPECSCFIADIKARFLKERDNSIRRLAEAKAQAMLAEMQRLQMEPSRSTTLPISPATQPPEPLGQHLRWRD